MALAEARSASRQTQAEVANAAGINRSQYAHLEAGRSGRFLAHLFRILRALDAEIHISWQAPNPTMDQQSVPRRREKFDLTSSEEGHAVVLSVEAQQALAAFEARQAARDLKPETKTSA